jgi:Mg/Co/Ni transporter MgtE
VQPDSIIVETTTALTQDATRKLQELQEELDMYRIEDIVELLACSNVKESKSVWQQLMSQAVFVNC